MKTTIDQAEAAAAYVHMAAIHVARCPSCRAEPGAECGHGLRRETRVPGRAHVRRVLRYLRIVELAAEVMANPHSAGDLLDLLIAGDPSYARAR